MAQRLALLPPALRVPFLVRVSQLVIEHSDVDRFAFLTTNLGISPRYRLRIGTDAPLPYFFGTPANSVGEVGALHLVRHLSERTDAFIDVGSYHGLYIFYLRHWNPDGVPIHFFEPVPRLFEEIQGNVRACGLPRVSGRCAALGAAAGAADFYVDLSDSSSSSLHDHFTHIHHCEPSTVTVETLDSFVTQHTFKRITVKVDVENAEFDVLRGAVGSRDTIAYLVMEVLGPAARAGFVRAVHAELGLQSYYINGLQLEHSLDGSFRYQKSQYNWLFCREDPERLRDLLRRTPMTVSG